ncbi:amidohydrolase family protein [Aquimarina pacifica]|uniref:amidohydrolase family protein n=1 Tax=Aquimarina pacifica TaxID=1296415 RepID=UPI00047019C4|nr:amidohydrolase family protein [Aquimarina pacifica]
MKYLIYFIVPTLLLGCRNNLESDYDLVIKNVDLIDGTGNPIQKAVTIAIDDKKIVAIGSESDVNARTVIDGTDKFLIPGLFDCHVHTGDFKGDFVNLIHYGITSIFVPGGSRCTNEYYAAMRLISKQDSIPAPRVFHTSQHFTMEGRHPAKTYGSFNRENGENIFYLKDTIQIENLVKQVAQYPILGIKITIEDGPTPPFVERIPQKFVNKTVKEASKYGLEVYAHVSDNIELEMAVKGGVQNLVHYTGVNIDPNNSLHLKWIENLREKDASWVTTLMIDKSFLYPLHPEWFDVEEMLPKYQKIKEVIEPSQIERAKIIAESLKKEYGIEESTFIAFVNHHVEDVKFLYDYGINMVLGSDTGNEFNFHGYSLHEEMQILELGGMKPLDIIKMGTLNASKMMKSDDTLGSIEVGKLADMILLDKNPLESISNSLSINTVIKNGTIQSRVSE